MTTFARPDGFDADVFKMATTLNDDGYPEVATVLQELLNMVNIAETAANEQTDEVTRLRTMIAAPDGGTIPEPLLQELLRMSAEADGLKVADAQLLDSRLLETYKTVAQSAWSAAREDVDRFRQHSTTLNAVSWRLSEALGDIPPGADSILSEGGLRNAERIIAELEKARRDLGVGLTSGQAFEDHAYKLGGAYEDQDRDDFVAWLAYRWWNEKLNTKSLLERSRRLDAFLAERGLTADWRAWNGTQRPAPAAAAGPAGTQPQLTMLAACPDCTAVDDKPCLDSLGRPRAVPHTSRIVQLAAAAPATVTNEQVGGTA